MNKTKICAALAVSAAATLGFTGSAHAAFTTFFGEDLNSSASTPLSSIPNATNAANSFLSNLTGVGTETFESQTPGASAPLALVFPGAGTGTLSGGNGSVVFQAAGTAGAGRYSIPSASSTNFWQVGAGGSGNFNISFTQSIAALGFYGIDIGDYGGQLTLTVTGTTTTTLIVPNTIGSNGSTDGSVLFYGLIAGAGEEFTSVSFNTTTGQGDNFAFDNFTIGTKEQVCTPGTPGCGGNVPEPGSLALAGLALAGLASVRRRKSV